MKECARIEDPVGLNNEITRIRELYMNTDMRGLKMREFSDLK